MEHTTAIDAENTTPNVNQIPRNIESSKSDFEKNEDCEETQMDEPIPVKNHDGIIIDQEMEVDNNNNEEESPETCIDEDETQLLSRSSSPIKELISRSSDQIKKEPICIDDVSMEPQSYSHAEVEELLRQTKFEAEEPWKKTVEEMEDCQRKLQLQVDILTNEHEFLKENQIATKAVLDKFLEEYDSMQARHKSLEELTVEIEIEKEARTRLQDECSQLTETNFKYDRRLKALEQKASNYQDPESLLEEATANFQKEQDARELERMKELDRLTSEMGDACRLQVERVKEEQQQVETSLAQAESQVEELQIKNERFAKELEDYRGRVQMQETEDLALRNRIIQLERENKDLQEKYNRLEQANVELHRTQESAATALVKATTKLDELSTTNDLLTNQVGELNSHISTQNAHEQDLRQKLAQLQSEKETFQNQCDQFQKTEAALRFRLNAAEHYAESLTKGDDTNTLKRQIEQLESDNDSLTRDNMSLREKTQELHTIAVELVAQLEQQQEQGSPKRQKNVE